jgi:hypothetical protein
MAVHLIHQYLAEASEGKTSGEAVAANRAAFAAPTTNGRT